MTGWPLVAFGISVTVVCFAYAWFETKYLDP